MQVCGQSVRARHTSITCTQASTTGSMSQAGAAFLLILGYGMGAIPLSYCLSSGFTSPSSAQVTRAGVGAM
jgi:hypothetical protein